MRGAPGVVSVQENRKTGLKHVVIPQIVQDDISFDAQDLVLFYKGIEGWVVRKISRHEKERIRKAHREGRDTGEALEPINQLLGELS